MSNQLNQVRNDVTGIYHDDGYIKMQDPVWFESSINGSTINGIYTLLTGITQTAITKSGTITGSNVLSTNETRLVALQTKTQNINDNGTVLTNIDTINGNRVGSPDIFLYDAVTPFIPVVGTDGITEVGNRIDFHRATNEEDYTVGLQVSALNRLSIRHNNTAYAGDLELGTVFFRNTGGTCSLFSNHHSNLQWSNNAGTNTWICDATTAGERWSTTRDNALAAFTRTTGMTHTPAVVEPDPAPARTSFNHHIHSIECYSGRYHVNSTSSLPINAVASASTWGAIRIQRTSLAQNTPCGFMFGRGNDTANMPKNLCAMYYVSPTTDISKGEIRIGVESEASTASTNCITFDTDTRDTRLPSNLIVNGSITDNGSKTITHYTQYEGDLQPGYFVESTGQVFHNGEPSSYENCMVTVRQATTFSNNIIGVCTEIVKEPIYEEHDPENEEEGLIRKIIGERITNKCRIATHGDCLIKCISDTYHIGDIIIPSSSDGYGKKGSSMEIID